MKNKEQQLKLNFLTLSLDLGKNIGLYYNSLVNKDEDQKSTSMWGVFKSNNLLINLFSNKTLQDKLAKYNEPLLMIVARPYLKSLKTSQYLIKQQAIIEYELLKEIADRNVYLLELNEMTVNAWCKGYFKDQWNNNLKAKENKYNICINYLLESGCYEWKYSEIVTPLFNCKNYNHGTDAYALYLYTKHNIEACVGKITPLKRMFAK